MISRKEYILVVRDDEDRIVSVIGKNNRVFEIYTTKTADLDDVESLLKSMSGQKDYLINQDKEDDEK